MDDENRSIETSRRHAEVKVNDGSGFDQGVSGKGSEKLYSGHILKLRLGKTCCWLGGGVRKRGIKDDILV